VGGFAGFTKGLSSVITPELEKRRDAQRAREDAIFKAKLNFALNDPNLDPETRKTLLDEAAKHGGGGKEVKQILGKVGGFFAKMGGHKQPSPAGAVPPMQQNGKQPSASDAMGAESAGAPQSQPSPGGAVPPRQQAQGSPGAVPPRKQYGPGESSPALLKAAGSRPTTGELQAQAREAEKYKNDLAISKEKATAADRLSLQETKDRAVKELEEQKAKHAKELLSVKDADTKTIQEMKDKQAKEIEALKAQHAKELFNAREAHKAALKAGSGGGGAAKEAAPKTYVPGGKSVHNPMGDLTIDIGAWDYINTGHLPFTGFSGGGKGQKNARELMLGRAGELLADAGLTPADLPAIRGKIKGDTSALAKVSTMGAMVKQFEGTLDRNMQTAKKLSEAWDRHDLRFLNRIEGAYKTGVGDAEALNLAAQLHGVAREWGKIMSGSTSAAGVQVSEANSTDEFFAKGITNGQLQSFMENVIVPDIRNRTAAIDEEKAKLVQSIRGAMGDMAAPDSSAKKPPVNGVPPRTAQPDAKALRDKYKY
jgi:hypothetical protein